MKSTQMLKVALVCLILPPLIGIGLAITPAQSQRSSMRTGLAPAAQATDQPIVRDSFTGADNTPLNQHSSDFVSGVGVATWSMPSYAAGSAGNKILINGGGLTHGGAKYRNIYVASPILKADSYALIESTVKDVASFGVGLRAATDGSENYYLASYSPSGFTIPNYICAPSPNWSCTVPAQSWYVLSNAGYDAGNQGHEYVLGTWFENLTAGDRRQCRFEAVGDELHLLVNGTLRINIDTYYHLEGGRAFVMMSGDSSAVGTKLDNFEAGNIIAPEPSPSPTPSASPTPSPSPSPSPGSNLQCRVTNVVVTSSTSYVITTLCENVGTVNKNR